MTTKPRKLTKEYRAEWQSGYECWGDNKYALDLSERTLLDALEDLDSADAEIIRLRKGIDIDNQIAQLTIGQLRIERDDARDQWSLILQQNSDIAKKLEVAREALKTLGNIIEAGGIEVYCDVNPEDCDHCVATGLINEALEKLNAVEAIK